MKLMIATGHNIKPEYIEQILQMTEVPASVLLAGTQRDKLLKEWAKQNNIPARTIVSNTRYHREYATYIRNELLAANSEMGLIIYDGKSQRLDHLIQRFINHGKPITVYRLTNSQATRFSWTSSSGNVPQRHTVKLCTTDSKRAVPSS